jgi:hypothetical protein
MNGCHSKLVPDRCQNDMVYHSDGKTSWKYIFTRDCQYSRQDIMDHGCVGCKFNHKQMGEL